MRRFVRRVFMLSVVAGTAYAVWRWFESQRSESGLNWEAQPAPFPPQPRTENPSPPAASVTAAEPVTTTEPVTATEPVAAQATPSPGGNAWVEPTGGTCPPSHPVKAKMSSKIFHVAGGLNYDRTHPDRCYRDAAAAEADGLRKSAR